MHKFDFISLLFLLLAGIMIFGACEREDYTTTVYLVRHAERETSDTTSNPPLSRDGFARAHLLKEMLGSERIEAIFTTYYRRNMQTVQPLAQHRNLELRSYEAHDWQPMLDFIKENMKGSKVVISGHSDNLLPMIEGFGGTRPQDSIATMEYDKMFKVLLKPDGVAVEVIEY